MKIFITGSAGFIGSELISSLSKIHKIIKYDISDGNDILDYNNLKNKMKGCDFVVHLAAIKKPLEDKAITDYFNVNCIGTLNVAKAAEENKVKRLIFASSMSYYGMEKGMPIQPPVKEDTLILTQRVKTEKLGVEVRDCDIAYSTSKVIGEQTLANFGMAKKIQVVILRFGPTRKRGEFRPFGELKLHLKIENAVHAIESAISTDKTLWYEAFTILDNVGGIDISKAKSILNYNPI